MTEDTKGWLIQWADQLQVLQDQMLELCFSSEEEAEDVKGLVTKAAAALDDVTAAIAAAEKVDP